MLLSNSKNNTTAEAPSEEGGGRTTILQRLINGDKIISELNERFENKCLVEPGEKLKGGGTDVGREQRSRERALWAEVVQE